MSVTLDRMPPKKRTQGSFSYRIRKIVGQIIKKGDSNDRKILADLIAEYKDANYRPDLLFLFGVLDKASTD